ncbi:MAG: YbjN domain-containing protein [Syntrophobacterales bacterium]|nr:YbjN domain-containing protein [Syntrophobacterales bacterium]
MSEYFQKVKSYLLNLDVEIVKEDPQEGLFVVKNEDRGLVNLVVDCEDPILIIEQLIMAVPDKNREEFFKRLLQMNRALIHGAFVVDEESKNVIFRDTLQLRNLDYNELEASILALEMALLEYGDELIKFTKA